MRRRRTKRKSMGVSLFPFLAVLICTLGVLIILLVLAVRSADVRASKDQAAAIEKQQQQQSRLSELHFEQDKRLVEIEILDASRPDSLQRLTNSREHRGHLEAEIRELKKKARALGKSMLALEESPVPAQDSNAGQRIDELKKQILAAQTVLKTKRTATPTNAMVTYAIVPHAGNGGTFRRPIFIECTRDAMVIQPLGIRLLKSEFAPPLDPGNMLDAALLAIREYWQKYDLEGTAGSPYPLLVVRPDGAETYVLARHAMSSWEDEFGYELVEADKNLDFGARDEQLAQQIQDVVNEARLRQRSMTEIRMAQQRAARQRSEIGDRIGRGSSTRASSQRPGLTSSGSAGGFVANSGWELPSNEEMGGNDIAQTGGQHQVQHNAGNPINGSAMNSTGNENQFGDLSAGQPSNSGSSKSGETGSEAAGQQSETAPDANLKSPYQNTSLAKQRGKNWALPKQTPGSTGYVRPIRVVCSADELEIRSALGTEKRIPIAAEFTDSVDPLVNEIWRQIESWGLSGERSYWKPELRISVVPGGELNFEKLRGALHESGVVVKESQQ